MAKRARRRPRDSSARYKMRVKAAFEAFDANKDGNISKDELASVLKSLDSTIWSDAAVTKLLADLDVDSNGVIDLNEFLNWVFCSELSVGRVAVEAALQRTLDACEVVPSAGSRLSSPAGDFRVGVHGIAGNELIADFGLFADEPLLILRHAAESVMKREPGYRCELLLGETVLPDEATARSAGLLTGSVLTAVLTIDHEIEELLKRLPLLTEILDKTQDETEAVNDETPTDEEVWERLHETLKEVHRLGCFVDPPSALPWGRLDAPEAGKRQVPGWSGPESLGPAVPIFAQWLKEAHYGKRQVACWCLGRVGVDALPLLPHLAAAAWDDMYDTFPYLNREAVCALCLLSTQAPEHVLPVLAELVLHEDIRVSRIVIRWLNYTGPGICFWRPMPGARDILSKCLKDRYPDDFSSFKLDMLFADSVEGDETTFCEEEEEEEEEEVSDQDIDEETRMDRCPGCPDLGLFLQDSRDWTGCYDYDDDEELTEAMLADAVSLRIGIPSCLEAYYPFVEED